MIDGGVPDGPGVVPPRGYLLVQDQTGNRYWVPPSKLHLSPPTRSELSDAQIERIQRFKQTLAEHDKTSLEVACDNFRRDANPDVEIQVWERIARTYSEEVALRGSQSAEERRLVYQAALQCSWSDSVSDLLGSNPALKSLPDLERILRLYEGTK